MKGAYFRTDGGELAPVDEGFRFLVGQQFTVSRETGRLFGDLTHPFGAQVTVIDPGSSEQSFKVVATSNRVQYDYLHYLDVQEFVESEDKPFFYRGAIAIWTGTCRGL